MLWWVRTGREVHADEDPFGRLQADEGEIYLDGKKLELTSPQVARDYGISVIYQDFNLANILPSRRTFTSTT